jgi:hypothetical protein
MPLRTDDGSMTASTGADSFVYAPLRVRINSVATAFGAPFIVVAFLGAWIGWALDALLGSFSLWIFAIPGLPALYLALWAIRRGTRVRLVVSQEGVLIDNTWRSYRFSWSEVDGAGIRYATSPFPQPVLWFRLIGRTPVVAQATPLRCSVRHEFLTNVLSYAPPSVQRLEDTVAGGWLGNDSAPSYRFRLWWVKKYPNGRWARFLEQLGA